MPPDIDPTNFQLALILTAAGATVAATIIASVIQVLKTLPGFGTWLEAGHETVVATVLSFLLVAYAYLVTTPAPDATNGFAAFLAFLGVAAIAGRAYDAGVAIKSKTTS